MGTATDEYIERLASVDPATNVHAEILFDTNVMMEIYTVADLLKLGDELGSAEAALGSPRYRWRQERSKHSTVLAWHVAKCRQVVGILGSEVIALLERIAGKPEPGKDGTSYVLAASRVRVVREFVLIPNGWREGGLIEIDHRKEGTQADHELLRIAIEDKLPLITWEGYSEGGFSSSPKSLRNKAKAAGVAAYTPKEYLEAEGVNVDEQCAEFVAACTKGVDEAKAQGMLGGHEVLDDIVPLYRYILLDVVNDALAHIPRPA
ncbi:MAG: hypothetical protein JWO36_790 [Myxococcales bacterium]|nr:hypothetical protein [Myxococcales bacterium]